MKREEFVKIAISEPKKAAEILRAQARELENARNLKKQTDVISKVVFISERTIFRDCKK